MIEKPIEIPGTKQLQDIPTISLYGGHKGHMGIQLDKGWETEVYESCSCDCIGSIFAFFKEKNYFEICEQRGFDLELMISTVVNYIWTCSNYAFPKCFECLDDKRYDLPKRNCPNLIMWDEVKKYATSRPDKKFHLSFEEHLSPVSLKDFDFRITDGPICLKAKIKNIHPPEVSKSGQYTQDFLLADDDTNKTIKSIFSDDCADYDKWKKGDSIIVYGYYRRFPKAKLTISNVFKDMFANESPLVFSENRNIKSPGYDHWRNTILSKDNQKCICCGHDKHLEVHHLFGYKENPELAIHPDNGVTLCRFCHDKYHSVYGLKNINPRDFISFIRRFGV